MKKAEGYVIRKLEEEYVLIPCGERAEEIPLAVIAAVRRVGCDGRVRKRIELQHGQLRADLAAEALRVLKFKFRLKGCLDVVGADVRAALTRGPEQVRGIHAARKAERRLGVFVKKAL